MKLQMGSDIQQMQNFKMLIAKQGQYLVQNVEETFLYPLLQGAFVLYH
jgi:hypothetical protein